MSSLVPFFRRKENWPILIIPLLLLIWGQFIAPSVATSSFQSVALFASPYRGQLAPGNPGQPVTSHVLIIVVDGLRVDASQTMATMNQLRQQGADRILQVGQPSFSLPGWTVIGTGAWQEQTGITTNFTSAAIDLDTIFLAARRAGLTTAIIGDIGWDQLYATGVDTLHIFDDHHNYTNVDTMLTFDRSIGQDALQVLQSRPNLTLVHFLGVDSASHGFGATSPQTAQMVQNIDTQIASLLSAVDLSQTAVFITADHGHIDRGGHGGWESIVLRVPFVAAGPGIQPGQYPDAFQADIAPTTAVLLGTAIPSHNQGDPLLDEINAPDSLKAARAVDTAQEISARYAAMLQVIGATVSPDQSLFDQAKQALSSGNDTQAITLAKQSDDAVRAQWDAARANRLNGERLGRLPLAALALIPFFLYLAWWSHARWDWKTPLVGAILYFVLWNVNYFLILRDIYSISMFNKEEDTLSFLAGRVVEAVIALLVAMIVVGIMRRKAGTGEVARAAVHMMFLVATALAVQIVIYYFTWGLKATWTLPDLLWGFKYYLDLLQTTAFWPLIFLPAAAVLPFIALLAAWIANRVRPSGAKAA